MSDARRQTQTGGREATGGHIPGDVALAVGSPPVPTPPGFRWCRLTDLARLETGHTPSRRVPEYWDGGTLPWIGVRDATGNHGRTIYSTNEYITELGEQKSSTRLLPANTVCLSRTASVGYVVVMGVPMCTSQDFVNWVCGPNLDSRYLKYILLAEKEAFLRFASGTTHQTVYFPEVKAFHVMVPEIAEQRAIAGVLGALDDKIESNRRMARLLEEEARTVFTQQFDASPQSVGTPLSDLVEINPPRRLRHGMPATYVAMADLPTSSALIERWDTRPAGSGQRFLNGDVLVARITPCLENGKTALVDVLPDGETGWGSTEYIVFGPREPLGSEWIYCLARSEPFVQFAVRNMTGTSGRQRCPATAFDSYLIAAPDPQLTVEFGRRFETSFRRMGKARDESRVLGKVRDALLPELLSGRLRVRDAEKVAGAV